MPLRLASSDGRAEIAIDFPPVNVLDVDALEELARPVMQAADARVLVLSGHPRAFSAGVSVAEHFPERFAIESHARRDARRAHRARRSAGRDARGGFRRLPGRGRGARLRVRSRLRRGRRPCRVPGDPPRVLPSGSVALLPARIGGARAAEWILAGRTVSGREAAEAGFASRALPSGAREGDRAARRESSSPPVPRLWLAPGLLRAERRRELAETLPRAEDAYRMLAGSEDLARAVDDSRRGDEEKGAKPPRKTERST